jgi:hypothetical protein
VNLKEVYEKQKEKGQGGHGAAARRGMQMANYADKDMMHMDVDDPPDHMKGKNRKCVLLSFSFHSALLIDPVLFWIRASQEANPKPQRKRNRF